MARSLRGPFGVGAGLTIDEFALWIYLDDVYWAEEGRSSIDAAVISAGLMLLVLLGARPFEFPTGSVAEVIAATFTAGILLSLVTACFVKQRVLHGALGLFLWPIALYGAAPSPSRDRRERSGSTPTATRASKRRPRDASAPTGRPERFKEPLRDKIGGTTNDVFQAKQAARHEAVAGPRHWAERERPLLTNPSDKEPSHDLSSICVTRHPSRPVSENALSRTWPASRTRMGPSSAPLATAEVSDVFHA